MRRHTEGRHRYWNVIKDIWYHDTLQWRGKCISAGTRLEFYIHKSIRLTTWSLGKCLYIATRYFAFADVFFSLRSACWIYLSSMNSYGGKYSIFWLQFDPEGELHVEWYWFCGIWRESISNVWHRTMLFHVRSTVTGKKDKQIGFMLLFRDLHRRSTYCRRLNFFTRDLCAFTWRFSNLPAIMIVRTFAIYERSYKILTYLLCLRLVINLYAFLSAEREH